MRFADIAITTATNLISNNFESVTRKCLRNADLDGLALTYFARLFCHAFNGMLPI